jgi:hypothetical protein
VTSFQDATPTVKCLPDGSLDQTHGLVASPQGCQDHGLPILLQAASNFRGRPLHQRFELRSMDVPHEAVRSGAMPPMPSRATTHRSSGRTTLMSRSAQNVVVFVGDRRPFPRPTESRKSRSSVSSNGSGRETPGRGDQAITDSATGLHTNPRMPPRRTVPSPSGRATGHAERLHHECVRRPCRVHAPQNRPRARSLAGSASSAAAVEQILKPNYLGESPTDGNRKGPVRRAREGHQVSAIPAAATESYALLVMVSGAVSAAIASSFGDRVARLR